MLCLSPHTPPSFSSARSHYSPTPEPVVSMPVQLTVALNRPHRSRLPALPPRSPLGAAAPLELLALLTDLSIGSQIPIDP